MSLCVYRSALCDTSEVVAVAYYAAVAEVCGTSNRRDGDGVLGSDRVNSAGGSGGLDLSCGAGYCGGLLRGCNWQCKEHGCDGVSGIGEGEVIVQGGCGDGFGSQGGDGLHGVHGSSGVDGGLVGITPLVVSGGVEQVDSRKLARREKNKRRRKNRKERKDGDSGSCFMSEWCGSSSDQSRGIDGVKDGCGESESVVSGSDCVKDKCCGGTKSDAVPVQRHGVGLVSSGLGDVGLKKGFFSDLSTEQRVELQASRAALLVKQNKLAAERADRELEVLKATDIDVEKKRQATKLRAAIERNMVSIEQTHAKLVATDNVRRDELDHDVHTVVTDGMPSLSSGSISPNSSASMAEFRAMQKENLDLKDKYGKMVVALEKIGLTERSLPFVGKDLWSVDSNGAFVEKNESLFDEVFPDGFAIDPEVYYVDGKPKKRVF